MKYIVSILFVTSLLSISNIALCGQTLTLTRVISQLEENENSMSINIFDTGEIQISYPKLHLLHGNRVDFYYPQYKSISADYFEKVNLKWNSRELQDYFNTKKVSAKNELFYSSDPNPITLSLIKDGQLVWEMSIFNLEELKHFNNKDQKYSELVQLIESIDNLSKEYIVTYLEENKK